MKLRTFTNVTGQSLHPTSILRLNVSPHFSVALDGCGVASVATLKNNDWKLQHKCFYISKYRILFSPQCKVKGTTVISTKCHIVRKSPGLISFNLNL